MGVIQGSINGMLGTAAAAISIGEGLMKKANTRAEQMAKQKQAQKQSMQRKKRDFMKYVVNIPLGDDGGKVGDLGKSAQKQIAQSYSKSEKTKIMNEMEGKK